MDNELEKEFSAWDSASEIDIAHFEEIQNLEIELAKREYRYERLLATADRRLELLKQIEWIHVEYIWFCPWCHSKKEDGHTDDCELEKELRGET